MKDNKFILVGVTGCIAAYKACEIVRQLQKKGYTVQVVMTEAATRFVGTATFEALTQLPVVVDLFHNEESTFAHITLAAKADAFLVAPCTANTLAKITYGMADNALTATALAVSSPLILAPAMNVHMWENPATVKNVSLLHSRGVKIVEPLTGRLACGDEGTGKLADIDSIINVVESVV